jgi:hypothetical protein
LLLTNDLGRVDGMKLVPTKTNREIISWLGGGAVVIVGGAWTLFTYLHDDKKLGAPMATVGTSSGSIIAPGATFNGPVSVFDEKNSEQINAALNRVQETLAALVARDKGVPIAPLRVILISKLGEKGVRDEDIPALLDKKADELVALRKQFAKLQSGPSNLASSAQQSQALLDSGDFKGALKILQIYQSMSMMYADFAKAESIATSMQSDNQKQQIERWRILQETQEQLFSIQVSLS